MTKFREFILPLARLEKEAIHLEGELASEFLELGGDAVYNVPGKIKYALNAQMISGSVLVSGPVEWQIAGECGRCLRPVERDMKIALSLFYDEIPENQEELDITDDLRTEMLLELPVNLLCSEDCSGLCPHCGADLNNESCKCPDEGVDAPGDASAWGALDDLDI